MLAKVREDFELKKKLEIAEAEDKPLNINPFEQNTAKLSAKSMSFGSEQKSDSALHTEITDS